MNDLIGFALVLVAMFVVIGGLIYVVETMERKRRKQMIDAGYMWHESGWFKEDK